MDLEQNAPEGRVNKVDRCEMKRPVPQKPGVRKAGVRVHVLAAGLVLLVAGCAIFGLASRLGRSAVVNSQSMAQSSTVSASTAVFPFQSPEFPIAKQAIAKHGSPAKAHSLFAGLPLIFEPNQGQANLDPSDARVRFIARGTGYSLTLGSEGAILSLRAKPSSQNQESSVKKISAHRDESRAVIHSVEMKLAGANPNPVLSGADLLPGKSNYILGNDPAKWHTGVPQFARVHYENVYPGINLVFYGNQGHLEYDFQVAPYADPTQAELEFHGAKALELKDGALVIKQQGGDVRLAAPHIYQQVAGHEQTVDGHFVLRGSNRAGFALGPYDRSRELVIDPALFFSAYFGGAGNELATSVAVDGAGMVYITGSTTSPTLPSGVVPQTVLQAAPAGPQNVYIAKINPIQNPVSLEYVTFLGGNGIDTPVGIEVDAAGNVYVAGTTTSTNFPTSATGYQPTLPAAFVGPQHVFASKVNPLVAAPAGLLYSTYLAGNGIDIASGMTNDGSGNIYVTGTTTSQEALNSPDQFPASNPPNLLPFKSISPGAAGQPEFFVTKIDTFETGVNSIPYSTYFGASNTANGAAAIALGGGIAVDANGNMYFDGTTNYTYTNGSSGDFPILNAFQPCLDQPGFISFGNIPTCTVASTQTLTDAFVAKINPNNAQGSQLQWSTYVGGTQTDSATQIGIDPQSATHVYVVGTTNSPDVTSLTTTTFGAFQACLDTPVNPPSGTACTAPTAPAPTDAFVAQLTNPTISSTTGTTNMSLQYFSYLGGTGNEAGLAITIDDSNGALITGWTQSADFPIFPSPNDGIQSSLTGARDAFAARLNTTAVLQGQGNRNGSWATYFGGTNTAPPAAPAATEGTGIALDTNEDAYFAGDTNSIDLPVTGMQEGSGFVTTNSGGSDAFVTELNTIPTLTVTGVLTLGNNQTFISAGNPATFTYTITNTGADLASNITFVDNLSQSVTVVPVTFVSATATSGTCSTASTANSVSCIISGLQSGSTATVTVVITPTATNNGLNPQGFNGGSVLVLGPHNSVLSSTQVAATMSDFTLAVTPPSASVAAAGDPAQFLVQLTPHPIYGTNVTLSCTGTPTGAACSFAPTGTVTLLGPSPSAATLNLTTTARPINIGANSGFEQIYAIWLAVPALAVFGVGVRGRRGKRSFTKRDVIKVISGMLMVYALLALIVPLPACSGTSNRPPTGGTPPGIYTITVTANSGNDSKSQAITLTVP